MVERTLGFSALLAIAVTAIVAACFNVNGTAALVALPVHLLILSVAQNLPGSMSSSVQWEAISYQFTSDRNAIA